MIYECQIDISAPTLHQQILAFLVFLGVVSVIRLCRVAVSPNSPSRHWHQDLTQRLGFVSRSASMQWHLALWNR